jgi:sialic acid synthase SpsE
MPELKIGDRRVADDAPTYFVADIAANHDGDLERARYLIQSCADAGADAAKFQNFRADRIVSDEGFRELGGRRSHQAGWTKSVFEVYRDASVPWEWTPLLKAECDKAGVEYFSAPYDLEAVDMLDPYVKLYKIGSGDLNWDEMLTSIARKGKPILLSTGASDMDEVRHAVRTILPVEPQLCLLQCNTNYTADQENFKHLHLNVLRTFAVEFPDVVLGLSDHTPGHSAVLGAIALGARVVEKHFTDDTGRPGPDHAFSMTPDTWREMVARSRELEAALGSSRKFVSANEKDTVVLQRRSVRAGRDLPAGTTLTRADLEVLRPAPTDALAPNELDAAVGRRVKRAISRGQALSRSDLE